MSTEHQTAEKKYDSQQVTEIAITPKKRSRSSTTNEGKGIPSSTFFGQSLRTFLPPILATASARHRHLQAIRNSSRNHFRIFSTQFDAFKHCDDPQNLSKCLQIWAFEIDTNGRRRFIAASYNSFWRIYSRILRRAPERPCHYYEVIRERHACKLYLDLEFIRYTNPNVSLSDAHEMTQLTIQKCLLKAATSSMNNDVMILESTTEKKFSVHLIFQGIVFYDNVQMNTFIQDVVEGIRQSQKHMMMVYDKDGKELVPFVDMGVYTKNRCFRLIGSSKFGKQARLLLPDNNKPNDRVRVSREEFMNSIVCNIRHDDTIKLLGHPTRTVNSCHDASSNVMKRRRHYAPNTINSSVDVNDGTSHSKYAALDEYVMSIINAAAGGIHGVTVFGGNECSEKENEKDRSTNSMGETVMYAIKDGYKYCERIGRHHKSNNVILIANIAGRFMFQKCFDPDCRGFRSRPWPIPNHVFGDYDHVDDDEDDSVDDEALIKILDEMEGKATDLEGGVPDEMILLAEQSLRST